MSSILMGPATVFLAYSILAASFLISSVSEFSKAALAGEIVLRSFLLQNGAGRGWGEGSLKLHSHKLRKFIEQFVLWRPKQNLHCKISSNKNIYFCIASYNAVSVLNYYWLDWQVIQNECVFKKCLNEE